ncbi:unnamed protein product [Phytophthora lilii]|uniref:Unnamed protein product n=1 Tax=Phytophthora lilii TaxID=2077276 RepID=A0A9W6UEB6_9STRA|nr:unnamed protein product [Phytophthora lilii]
MELTEREAARRLEEQRAKTAPTAVSALSSMIRAHSQPAFPPHVTPSVSFSDRENGPSINYDEMWSHSFALRTNQQHELLPLGVSENHDKRKKKQAAVALQQTEQEDIAASADQSMEQLQRIANSDLNMVSTRSTNGLTTRRKTHRLAQTSLYADGNHVKDIEGIVELRKLWKLDLNDNLLKNLHALASFRALGFLYLERNKIDFEDLVCIRDVHLLEMRLVGNTGLLKGNTTNEYRKKVVALLPNVWILDGHFITTTEREQAVEDFDQFVSSLLKQPQRSAGVVSKFGSATDVWVESEITTDNSAEWSRSSNFIGVAHKSPPPEEPPDMRRLHAVVLFHNEESTIHNAHNHFAPSRYAPNARLMPKVWLDEVLALPRRTRLEFIVLVATFLEFRFPKVLMLEALLIRQLDCPHFPSEAIRDTVDLPPYALVALVAVARHYSIKEEQTKRDELRPEVTSPEFEDESAILSAIPPLFSTLLSPQNGSIAPQDSSELQATAIRCRQAIRLLSNVASFPDPEMVAFKGKGNRDSVFRELMPLIRAAEAVQANSTTQSGREVVPSVTVTNHKSADVSISKHNSKMMWKRSPITEKPSDIPGENQQYTVNLDRIAATGSATRRKPKPGDWVEVRLKQFVKIQFLSADGLFVVGSSPTNSSRAITISIEQLSRISSTVWRVKHLTKEQAVGLFTNTQHTNSDCFSTDKARVGKLHRDSEAFHRHGAARNQGFPNHFVTTEILADLARQRSPSSSRPKAIEIFSSNDTLDANYVLTSPEHISAQNFCAVSTFQRDRRPARGLWSPMKQCAPAQDTEASSPVKGYERAATRRLAGDPSRDAGSAGHCRRLGRHRAPVNEQQRRLSRLGAADSHRRLQLPHDCLGHVAKRRIGVSRHKLRRSGGSRPRATAAIGHAPLRGRRCVAPGAHQDGVRRGGGAGGVAQRAAAPAAAHVEVGGAAVAAFAEQGVIHRSHTGSHHSFAKSR